MLQNKKYKIIVFDMDGVIIDSIPFAKQSFIAAHPGITEEQYNDLHTGNYHDKVLTVQHLRKPETEEEKLERQLEYSKNKVKAKLFPGIFELLRDIHKSDNILAMNTNAYDRNTYTILEKNKIKDFFDIITTADLTKDKVVKFKIIQDKFNAQKDEMVFITDALGDVKDAEEFGIDAIAVTWGVHDREFFEKEKRDNMVAIVDTVEELKNFVLNNN